MRISDWSSDVCSSDLFEDYREGLKKQLKKLGYKTDWRLLNASDFGVPQLRPRVLIVAIKEDKADKFEWPEVAPHNPPTVGEVLQDLMAATGWRGAATRAQGADEIEPTSVGDANKHGSPNNLKST